MPSDAPSYGESIEELAARMEAEFGARAPTEWGYDLPGTLRRVPVLPEGRPLVLTLDACGRKYDGAVIALLRERRIPATLFVTDKFLAAHPVISRKLAEDPLFELAAHGSRHLPASVNGRSAYGIAGTASVTALVREVETNVRKVHAVTGVRPAYFRPGTAFCDEVALAVLGELGLTLAGFAIAGDAGATLPAPKIEARLLAAQPGDILLCHISKPGSAVTRGLRRALPPLSGQGFRFVRLSDAMGAA